ncbi:MAG: glycosyltransferase family 4 protein [Anaerolineales bacterium]|nr:glycosyltransferase family 4 protein [Anaerolineales bacterium]MCB0017120.1 glycosyltransferase family 4 protein [Anaerolineales bacterium]MCB8961356.1 glycosyltransferase family 4 protein [Ardenticatenales bacterium]
MNKVLLTVSGRIDPAVHEQIRRGERPRTDYVAMAEAFGADLLDFQQAEQESSWFGRLLGRLSLNLMLAWACFRRRRQYEVLFSDGEQVGLPLALMLRFLNFGKRPQHLMIVHILSVGKKMLVMDWLKPYKAIDLFLPYATWQKQFIESRWGVPPDRVAFTHFMVDADFFSQAAIPAEKSLPEVWAIEKPVLCSVGLEFRDYPTLMKAVAGLDCEVIIAAASPWSKRDDSTAGQDIPANVTVRRFTQYELRELYAVSRFVIMPLYNVNFQAGITTILEAMAMEKAIICSRTPGQTDVIQAGETGLYVTPEDPVMLRGAIEQLLQNPAEARAMGQAGRSLLEQEMSLTKYVERLNCHVQQARKQFHSSK